MPTSGQCWVRQARFRNIGPLLANVVRNVDDISAAAGKGKPDDELVDCVTTGSMLESVRVGTTTQGGYSDSFVAYVDSKFHDRVHAEDITHAVADTRTHTVLKHAVGAHHQKRTTTIKYSGFEANVVVLGLTVRACVRDE